MHYVCGLDEAGRGPVIGPLVVAGVKMKDESILEDLGVRDSKRLTREKRDMLAIKIRRVAEQVVVRKMSAELLDKMREEMNINRIEAKIFADVIKIIYTSRYNDKPKYPSIKIYVDSADASEKVFKSNILKNLSFNAEIVCEHYADEKYPIVSAASIIAKSARDEEMEKISKKLNANIGSGYPSDPKTISFLESWVKKYGTLPPHTRRSWATARRILRHELTLESFGGE